MPWQIVACCLLPQTLTEPLEFRPVVTWGQVPWDEGAALVQGMAQV